LSYMHSIRWRTRTAPPRRLHFAGAATCRINTGWEILPRKQAEAREIRSPNQPTGLVRVGQYQTSQSALTRMVSRQRRRRLDRRQDKKQAWRATCADLPSGPLISLTPSGSSTCPRVPVGQFLRYSARAESESSPKLRNKVALTRRSVGRFAQSHKRTAHGLGHSVFHHAAIRRSARPATELPRSLVAVPHRVATTLGWAALRPGRCCASVCGRIASARCQGGNRTRRVQSGCKKKESRFPRKGRPAQKSGDGTRRRMLKL